MVAGPGATGPHLLRIALEPLQKIRQRLGPGRHQPAGLGINDQIGLAAPVSGNRGAPRQGRLQVGDAKALPLGGAIGQ